MLLDSLTHTLRAANTTSSASLKRIIKINKVLNFTNQNEIQPAYNYFFGCSSQITNTEIKQQHDIMKY